jgi:hypothetical protein
MSEIVIYRNQDSQIELEVKLDRETFWLSLNQIADLFERDKSVISRHLRNIFKEEELIRSSVVAKNATTGPDGKTYLVEYFNLDAIISVGYRVNSKKGTQFRQWATQRLKDYLVQGYAVNQKRLDQLQKVVSIIQEAGSTEALDLHEARGLLQISKCISRATPQRRRLNSPFASSASFASFASSSAF